MDRIVIVGTDSAAGEAIAGRLAGKFEVNGFWFRRCGAVSECPTSRIELARLTEQIELADTVYFCGGAAQSSWDARFGDFSAEEKWLAATVELSANAGAGLIYVSSDAIYSGPWVFHDDDYAEDSSTDVSAELRSMEALVATHPDHLIVRTNIVGRAPGGNSFADQILQHLQSGRARRVAADVYSTPISAADFAMAVAECGIAETTGVINIGGAERTAPFRFASLLANSLGYDCDLILPLTESVTTAERSLRCTRLRQELKLPPPLLRETLEQVCATVADQAPQSAAA